MNAYQVLAIVATVLSLVTTIGMTVAGWIVSGERTKRAKVETQLEEIRREVTAMQLEMAKEYVRSPQLETILEQLRTEIGNVSANVSKALDGIHKLEIQMAQVNVAQGRATSAAD